MHPQDLKDSQTARPNPAAPMRLCATVGALLFLVPVAFAGELDLLRQVPYAADATRFGVWPGTLLGDSAMESGWVSDGSGDIVRGISRRSRVHLIPQGLRDQELAISCAARAPSDEGLRISVLLNGRRLGIVRFQAAFEEIRFPLSSRDLRPGKNRLEIKNSEAESGDADRQLQCRQFAIRNRGTATFERIRLTQEQGGRVLHLTPGTSLGLFAERPADAILHIRLCDGEARLTITGEGGGSIQTQLLTGVAQELALGELRGGFAKLRLDAGPMGARVCQAALHFTTPERSAVPAASHDKPENLLLIVIDTLRADRVGVYGGTRGLTPAIDRLADGGLVFKNVLAQSSWTTPATASILTGTHPTTHGARRLGVPIAPQVPSLAVILQDAGFSTGAVITNINVRGELGFSRGFGFYHYLPETEEQEGFYAPASRVLSEALAWLDGIPKGPFFLYLHLSEPHAPYAPEANAAAQFVQGKPSAELFAADNPLALLEDQPALREDLNLSWLRSIYDAEVATVDGMLQDLRTALEVRGLWSSTLIVLTSDHGEAFNEHGMVGHGRSLFAEEVQIPLIFRWGDSLPSSSEDFLATQIDIVPTVLDIFGRPLPSGLEGTSLLRGGAAMAWSETQLHRPSRLAVVVGHRKVVLDQSARRGERAAVYDVRKDPQERQDLAATHPILIGWVRQEATRRQREAPHLVAMPVSPSAENRLRMLGYVD